jgi:hypothetical protein
MKNYYSDLEKECKNIFQKVKKDNTLLSGNILSDETKKFLTNNWNAFLIGLISDQSIKTEIAWKLPYELSKRLGHFDLQKILNEHSVEGLECIIKEKPALHRYPHKIAEYIMFAIDMLVKEYNSDAEEIWKYDLNAEHIIDKLERFKGISHKKAALGTLLLVRDFDVELENLSCIDITYDLHIRRTFLRMGLVEKDNISDVTSVAKKIHGEFPGMLTLPFWVTGRDYCRPTNPNCAECYLKEFCLKKIELGKDI